MFNEGAQVFMEYHTSKSLISAGCSHLCYLGNNQVYKDPRLYLLMAVAVAEEAKEKKAFHSGFCPLRNSDCLKAQCRWWNSLYFECSVLSIARSLTNLRERR